MKKVCCLVLAVALALTMLVLPAWAADYSTAINGNIAMVVDQTKAVANNTIIELSTAPVIVDGRTLVPVRFVSEQLGGLVSWNPGSSQVHIEFGAEKIVDMIIGSKTYTVSGMVKTLDVAPQIINDSAMLPLRALVEDIIGYYVHWDNDTRLIVISSRRLLNDHDTAVCSTIANAILTGVLPPIVISSPVATTSGGMSFGGGGGATGQIKIVSSDPSDEPQPENAATMSYDGSLGTRFATQGSQEIVYDLGGVCEISSVKTAFWKPTERIQNYGIYLSETGKNWSQVFNGSSDGSSTWETHQAGGAKARYVRLTFDGTSVGDWTSLLECEIYGTTGSGASLVGGAVTTTTTVASGGATAVVTTPPAGTKLNITNANFSQEPELENPGKNVFDNNASTVWASQGEQYMTIDLGSVQNVTGVGIQMKLYEDDRVIPWKASLSSDGASYNDIIPQTNSEPMSSAFQYAVLGTPSAARYVRIYVYGNTVSGWSSVAEVAVYSGGAGTATTTTTVATTSGTVSSASGVSNTPPSGTKLNITSATFSEEPELENAGKNAYDGNPDTVWASKNEQFMTIDLGSVQNVTGVGTQMKLYEDDRTIDWMAAVSTDGANFTNIMQRATSEPMSNAFQYAALSTPAAARYVRIYVYGNTVSGWTSLAEVAVYSGGAGTAATATTTTTTTATLSGGTVSSGGTANVGATAPSGTKFNITSATASQEPEATNPARNAYDKNASTVWASQGEQYITVDLGSTYNVTGTGIQMKLYDDDRTIPWKVGVSNDGVSFTDITGKTNSVPQSNAFQYANLAAAAAARYVRFTVYGNTNNGWNSVAEIEVYTNGAGTATTTPTAVNLVSVPTLATVGASKPSAGTKFNITSATASQEPETANPAKNAYDGSAATFWASQGEQYLTVDLGANYNVTGVGTQMRLYDDDRLIPWKVALSFDGVNYTDMVAKTNSVPQSNAFQYANLATAAAARYVRIYVYGNTNNGWNSLAEVEVYTNGTATVTATADVKLVSVPTPAAVGTSKPSGAKFSITSATASQEPETANPAKNAYDGSAATFWASQGEQYLTVDLGANYNVTGVGTQMRLYDDDRLIPWKVALSFDGVNYTDMVAKTNSVPQSNAFQYANLATAAAARYVRIYVYGNTNNGWNSLAEVEVYTNGVAAAN